MMSFLSLSTFMLSRLVLNAVILAAADKSVSGTVDD